MLGRKLPQNNTDDAARSFMPKDFIDNMRDNRTIPQLNGISLNAVFRAAGNQYALSPALLKAISEALSGLKPDAVSPGGKLGLMQLTPGIARMLRLHDPFDPIESVFGGARYLRLLLDRSRGNLRLALAAYFNGIEAAISTEAPLSRDTQDFIELVYSLTAAYAGYKGQEQKGKLFTELAGLLKNGHK